jgi:hypothetical protein
MFPESQTPSPGPERPFIGSGSLSVFGEPESPKMSDHPMRYRLSPRPLPPRHVRTRRDSLFQRYRATNNGGLGAANASISTVLDLEPDFALDTSPLGMLFGTVVQEGSHDPFATSAATGVQLGRGTGSLSRRTQAMSALSDAAILRRRRSSNVSVGTRPKMAAVSDTPQPPETVQETRDEEESGIDPKKREDEVMRMLGELERRQVKIEGQLDQLIGILQHQR